MNRTICVIFCYDTNGSIVVLLYDFCDIISLNLTLRKLKLYGVIVARLSSIILAD